MKKSIFIFLLIIICSIYNFAQSDSNSAPVKWEKYKVSTEDIEIMFPKLPVHLDSVNLCKQITTLTYYAFGEETVYELKVYKKSEFKFPKYCVEKEKFTEKNFSERVIEIKTELNKDTQLIKRGDNDFIKFEKQDDDIKNSIWLLNDYKNLRWFEFNVTTYDGIESKEIKFIDSLKLSASLDAIEINNGSIGVLGDDNVSLDDLGEKNPKIKNSPLKVIFKPKPSYTDLARKSNTVGTVKLRVTFLRNGGIGSISVVEALKNGLTEQAIAAAKKMAFLPMKIEGQSVSVTKIVVYSFLIY